MTIEFKLPELGESIESGDLVNVLVAEGDVIEPNQGVFELETDKAVVEIPCNEGGKIVKIHVSKGDRVRVGQVLLTLEPDEPPVEEAPTPAEKPEAAVEAPVVAPPTISDTIPETAEVEQPIAAGPTTRKLARELGVDLSRVQGSGMRGRITPEDVQAAAGGAAPVMVEPVVAPGEPGRDDWGPTRRERLSQIRKTIAKHMAHSAATIPHVTNFDDADVTELEHFRKGVPRDHFGPDVKLTMMPLLMKAVALSLRLHPTLNASLDEKNDEIVYKEYVNLGVAVDTARGLVVPVVRDVDRMPISAIAAALAGLTEQARTAQFAIEDLRGGTFTISNLGAVGGVYSTPIINHPEVAILLVGRSRWMPVVRDGEIVKRFIMPLSLSYDHRVVDGATAGRFLNEVIDYLQSPGKLLLA